MDAVSLINFSKALVPSLDGGAYVKAGQSQCKERSINKANEHLDRTTIHCAVTEVVLGLIPMVPLSDSCRYIRRAVCKLHAEGQN